MPGLVSRLLAGLLVLLLSGCNGKSDAIMRVGLSPWTGFEPIFLARELQYLDTGKIKLAEYSSMSQTSQFFRNGLIDAAATTLDQALFLLSTGEAITIVLVFDVSNGGDAIVAKPGISRMADLRGKRVGVENNILGTYMLTRSLELSAMSLGDIQVRLMNIDEHEASFNANKVDAVVTFDPVRTRLIKSGNKAIFDSRQLPWEIVDVLAVKNEFLHQHPESVQHFIDGWYRALEFFRQKPQDAATIIGRRIQLGRDETLKLFEDISLPDSQENYQLLMGAPEPLLLTTANRLAGMMYKNGLLTKQPDTRLLFATSPVQHIKNN